MLRKLFHTWDDIFSKEIADFYVPKASLISYIENGLLYFTDIEYKMSVDERLAHIDHVIAMSEHNPNLNFYVLGDDFDQFSAGNFNLSLYANKNYVFLKNITRFHKPYGPPFYSILNKHLATGIFDAIDSLKTIKGSHHFDSASLVNFVNQNRESIHRALSLSELKNPY